MNILVILLVLIVVGFLLWVAITYVPMPEIYKKALVVIVIVLIIVWLLAIIGNPSWFVIPRT